MAMLPVDLLHSRRIGGGVFTNWLLCLGPDRQALLQSLGDPRIGGASACPRHNRRRWLAFGLFVVTELSIVGVAGWAAAVYVMAHPAIE